MTAIIYDPNKKSIVPNISSPVVEKVKDRRPVKKAANNIESPKKVKPEKAVQLDKDSTIIEDPIIDNFWKYFHSIYKLHLKTILYGLSEHIVKFNDHIFYIKKNPNTKQWYLDKYE